VCLATALKTSSYDSDLYSKNLAFLFKPIPGDTKINPQDIGVQEHMQLTYQVAWPISLVVTESALAQYRTLFTFLLGIKRTTSVLRDIWSYFKVPSVRSQGDHRWLSLQRIRHEMQHFVNILQEYVINQVLDICWKEFRAKLETQQNVLDLNDLRQLHEEYLDHALRKCLLNKKAAPVQKIFQSIFGLILKFRMQLHNHPTNEPLSRSTYEALLQIQKSFQQYTQFLYQLLTKLSARNYQSHLQQLLLLINYNEYYEKM